jgi:FtsH-binding integral membrane protein
MVTAPVETSQEKATSSERHRWQEERQKFHRRTQKVVSARWGALSVARGLFSVATTQPMAAIYVNIIFMVAKFAVIVKYRSYIC